MKSLITLLPVLGMATLAHGELIGFYSFDDAADPLKDDSGSGNALQSADADPTYDPEGGVEGGAFEFDGFQRLIVPIDINPGALSELTLGAWVKTASLEPGRRKVMGHDDEGWDRTIGLDDRREGDFRYTAFVGNDRPVLGTPGPESEDHWTFLAVTFDQAENEVTVYVDLDSSTTDDTLVRVTEPTGFGPGHVTFSIGNLRPDDASEGWVGLIDNAFVFDEVLDAGQVKQLRDKRKEAFGGELPANDPAISVDDQEVFGRLPARPGEVEGKIGVANVGASKELEFSAISITGEQNDFYRVADRPELLGPGGTAEITVVFDPGDDFGDFQATLVIESNDVATPAVMVDLFARVSAPSISGSLLGFYTFDNLADPLADSSGQANDLTEPADDGAKPAYGEAAGVLGGAYTYDGNDRLIAPININPAEEAELTIGAWVKTSSLEPGQRKVLGHDNGGWDRTIGLDSREGDFRYTSFTGEDRPVLGTPGPENTDAWTFLAVTYDQPSNEVTVFVDADVRSLDDDLVVVTEMSGFGPGLDTFAIGGLRPDDASEGWQGEIDNVFVARGILSVEQLDEIRVGGRTAIELFGFGPPREDLVAFWTFDNPEEPLGDDSGNGNELEDRAPPTYVPDGGFEGGAFDFEGQQRLVADIDINVDAIPEMTWGAWVKPSNLSPALKKVMGHDNGSWDRTIGLDTRNNGDFRYTSFVGYRRPVVDTPGPVNTEDWTFLAVVYDEPDGEVTVYVDLDAGSVGDELVAVAEETRFNTGQAQFSIGSLRPDNNNEGWEGLIDNPFLYGTTLTSAQLAFIRDRGSAAIFGVSGDDPDLSLLGDPVFVNLETLEPVTQSVLIQNIGRSQALTMTSATIVGPDETFYTIDAFPVTLEPGGHGRVEITFDPADQVGDFEARLRLESNDASQPVMAFDLSATTPAPGPLDPVLVGPSTSPFGELTSGVHQRRVTIQNTGASHDLVISGVEVIGKDAARYTLGPVPAPMAPGASGEIEVTFDSGGEFMAFEATLRIKSSNAGGRITEFDLSSAVPIENLEDALFAYYSFDDPADPLRDEVPERLGDTSLTIPATEPEYMAEGGFEGTGAYAFDGSQRLVAEIDINVDVIPELTLGAWVKPSNLDPARKKVIGHDGGGWDRTIGLDNRNGVFRYTAFVGNRRPVVDTPGPVNTNDWTFLAVVYDQPNGEVTVYVDLDAATLDDAPVAVTEPTNFNPGQTSLSIGSLRPDNNSEGWQGLIDRAFFFDVALDAVTIREIRDGGVLPGGEDPNLRLRGGFGNLGKNPGVVTREIAVQNSGKEQVLTLTGTRLSGPDAASYTLGEALPATLAPGESVMLNVTFDPGGREGGFVAFLEVDSSDPGDPTETLDLSALIPAANDLVAHYRLDEADGVTMLDASGNGAHGMYLAVDGGGFTLGQDSLASGKAVAFDNAGGAGAGYGEIPAGAGIPELTHFSVSMWVNQAADDSGVSALFAKGEAVGDPFAVATQGGALVWFSSGTQTLNVDDAITPGERTHVLTTFDTVDGQPTAAFYVNGVEVGRESGVQPVDDSNPSVLQIGALNGAFGFKGMIDDVQIYGQTLDADEALFLFENPGKLIGEGSSGVPPVRLGDIDWIQVTESGIELSLPEGATVDIQYSPDLVNWEVIADGATGSFIDDDAGRRANPAGFYRGRTGN